LQAWRQKSGKIRGLVTGRSSLEIIVPNSLLTTKLFIPSPRPALVPRAGLVQRLSAGLHRTLTLVSAPAGFGKTTLVAEWIAGLRLEGHGHPNTRVAWLSIDEADNDLKRFLTYLLTALMQLDILDADLGESVLAMLGTPDPISIETVFTPLISALGTAQGKGILVLDDYHRIEDLTIHRALNFWLENVPPQIHTVVITREDPPFPLPRLRARDQLTELRAADLRFTIAESTQFLNEIMELNLEAESVSLLEQRTEGWIAGLQMAALSMGNREDTVGFIENFSGTHRYILDYLLEEVLANQPAVVQEFLLRTSILERLCAPLCDTVLRSEESSAPILAYLEQANLFLVPLDDARNWYRYHHLFSDLLNARLQQTHDPQELAGLHTRAARWYEENGMAFSAIYHASLIPDDAWVERLIDQNYMEIFQRRDSATIRNWTGELGKELIFKRPQLALHEANSRAWFGQLDEANQLLDEAEKRLEAETLTPDVRAMLAYLAYVRSRITAMQGDYEGAIQLCTRARADTHTIHPGLLGGIDVMLGYGYFLNGDFPQAEQILQQTVRDGVITGAINTTIGAYCVLARLYALQGRLQKSYDLYQEAQDFIQKSQGQHLGAMSIVDVGKAEVLYEWNDLEHAQMHIQQGLGTLARWSKADDFALARVVEANIHAALGDPQAAQKSIEQGVQVIRSSGVFPEARDAVMVAEIEQGLKGGDDLAVYRWAGRLEKRLHSDQAFRFENELALLTLARIQMVQGKYENSLGILSRLETGTHRSGRVGRLIKILILGARVRQQMGELDAAFSFLARALAYAEPQGYVRIFLDEGRPMLELLTGWLAQAEPGLLSAYANHLVSQFDEQAAAAMESVGKETPIGGLLEPLTRREIEVLNLIAQGKTNKEIATALVVSPGTVKAHTSNIYRKLEVANRTEAVARARELEILL
jgi:LuxR family maltose regulon positive regulatory protein